MGWGTIAVAGDEPGFVVVPGELDERGSELSIVSKVRAHNEADLGRNLEDLHDRVQRGAYRALPLESEFARLSAREAGLELAHLELKARPIDA